MKIVVGSTNESKRRSVFAGCRITWPVEPTINVFAVDAESWVSEHPLTRLEAIAGARHRAQNALKLEPEADYWIGPQRGLERVEGDFWVERIIVVVYDQKGREGLADGVGLAIPLEEVRLLQCPAPRLEVVDTEPVDSDTPEGQRIPDRDLSPREIIKSQSCALAVAAALSQLP